MVFKSDLKNNHQELNLYARTLFGNELNTHYIIEHNNIILQAFIIYLYCEITPITCKDVYTSIIIMQELLGTLYYTW